MRRIVGLLLAFTILVGPAAQAARPFTLRFLSEPETYDWNLNLVEAFSPLFNAIMEGLYEIDDNLNPVPRLAVAHEVSADGLRHTVHLRPGVQWSDGKPLVAQDFVDAWKRLLDPRRTHPYAYIFSVVREVTAPDASTLVFTLKEPCGYFRQLLAMRLAFPMRADVLKKFGNIWPAPSQMPVLGPYVIASRDTGFGLKLVRNPRYFDKPAALPEIDILISADHKASLSLFRKGELDYIPDLSDHEIDAPLAAQLQSSPVLHTYYIYFNVTQYPFNLPKVRQAIARAIDYEHLPFGRQGCTLATSLVPPVLEGMPAVPRPRFDPKSAKELLADTGLAPDTLPKIELVAPDGARVETTIVQVTADITKNLGLKFDLGYYPAPAYRLQMISHRGGMVYYQWTADFADADTFLRVYASDSGANRASWSSRDYDELVRKIAALSPGPERSKLIARAEDILINEQAVIIPLFRCPYRSLVNPRVHGLKMNPLGQTYLRKVSIF